MKNKRNTYENKNLIFVEYLIYIYIYIYNDMSYDIYYDMSYDIYYKSYFSIS